MSIERDPFAPIIGGFDCSGLTDPYSLRCEPFFTDGENGGTLLDGSTVHDILASKVRFSWALTAMTPAQYAALIAATEGAEALDTVSAYVYDATIDAVRLANFHVTRPVCRTVRNMGQTWAIPQSELVLEEASPIARFAVTPPTRAVYEVGDALDLAGLSVTRYDNDGNAADITAECATVPANGAILDAPGAVFVAALLPDGMTAGTFAINVAAASYVVTPPTKTAYERGEPLDLAGVAVTRYAVDGSAADVTADCVFDPAENAPVLRDFLTVRIGGKTAGTVPLTVSAGRIVASGDWWTLNDRGSLYVFKSGALPDWKTTDQAYEPDEPAGVIYTPWWHYTRQVRSAVIAASVTYIGTGNFYWRWHDWSSPPTEFPNLSTVEILGPASVGSSAFTAAPIARVSFPPGTEAIGASAFYNCSTLASVEIPQSVKTIGNYAFRGCALTSVTIASDCALGTSAFPDGCQIQYYNIGPM